MTQFKRLRTSALLGAGLLLIGGAALAQDDADRPGPVPNTPPPADATVGGVTVTAPRTVEQNRDGVTSQVIMMSVHVPYGDLDMHSPQGVSELDKRVHKAADYVCNRLAGMYPNGYPDNVGCSKAAVADASPQIIKAKAGG